MGAEGKMPKTKVSGVKKSISSQRLKTVREVSTNKFVGFKRRSNGKRTKFFKLLHSVGRPELEVIREDEHVVVDMSRAITPTEIEKYVDFK